jgi:SpoU rRNA methylase family enzyme
VKGTSVQHYGPFFWVIMVFPVSNCLGGYNEIQLFSLNYLYPHRYFSKVETTAKKLLGDLYACVSLREVVWNTQEGVSCLQKQSKELEKAVHIFVDHDDVGNYLYEDVIYLIGIVDLLIEQCGKIEHADNFLHVALRETHDCAHRAKSILERMCSGVSENIP